jgi:hypothetical protein
MVWEIECHRVDDGFSKGAVPCVKTACGRDNQPDLVNGGQPVVLDSELKPIRDALDADGKIVR